VALFMLPDHAMALFDQVTCRDAGAGDVVDADDWIKGPPCWLLIRTMGTPISLRSGM